MRKHPNLSLLVLPVLLLLAAGELYAATISYYIDARGYVHNSSPYRFYENARNGTSSYWVIDDAANKISYQGNGGMGMQSLKNIGLQASDITDITYSDGGGTWMSTKNNPSYSYYLQPDGSVTRAVGIRYYENPRNSTSGYWALNDGRNTISFIGYGGKGERGLATREFLVSDIIDVTYSPYLGNVWVTTNKNRSYYINAYGQVLSSSSLRFYENPQEGTDGYWTLNDAFNTIAYNGIGGAGIQTLKTSLFRVSDITDITYGVGNGAWVTVSTVPVPGAVWLFASGIIGFLGMARRKMTGDMA